MQAIHGVSKVYRKQKWTFLIIKELEKMPLKETQSIMGKYSRLFPEGALLVPVSSGNGQVAGIMRFSRVASNLLLCRCIQAKLHSVITRRVHVDKPGNT